jgi:hypothetical protein
MHTCLLRATELVRLTTSMAKIHEANILMTEVPNPSGMPGHVVQLNSLSGDFVRTVTYPALLVIAESHGKYMPMLDNTHAFAEYFCLMGQEGWLTV